MSGFRDNISAIPGQQFIDPAVLSRIGNLELVARGVVDGFISGLHRSTSFGMSVDFAEHRAYQPGDDVRRIDWRLFARTDRLYVREFEADSNCNLHILLDVSRSMDYGSGELSKLDYAKYLGASIAYLGKRQRDRTGLICFDEDIVESTPPSARHFNRLLHTLDHQQTHGSSDYESAFERIGERLKRRSIVALISDLYVEPDRLLHAVESLRCRGNDLIVFHVLDQRELDFEIGDTNSIYDLESGARMPISVRQFASDYQRQVSQHCAELQQKLGAARVDYIFADTSKPLDELLFGYLVKHKMWKKGH